MYYRVTEACTECLQTTEIRNSTGVYRVLTKAINVVIRGAYVVLTRKNDDVRIRRRVYIFRNYSGHRQLQICVEISYKGKGFCVDTKECTDVYKLQWSQLQRRVQRSYKGEGLCTVSETCAEFLQWTGAMNRYRNVYRNITKNGYSYTGVYSVLPEEKGRSYKGRGLCIVTQATTALCLTSEACTEVLERTGVVYSYVGVYSVFPKEREYVKLQHLVQRSYKGRGIVFSHIGVQSVLPKVREYV